MRRLRIGTRGSPLARWQAEAVAGALARAGGPAAELVLPTQQDVEDAARDLVQQPTLLA